jgi:hypothetical protein
VAGVQPVSAGAVDQAGLVTVRWVGSSVVDKVVRRYRLPDDQQPPSFPFPGRFRWLIGAQQLVPAEGASTVLPGKQAQGMAVHRGFDLALPLGPVFDQRRVVGRRPAFDQGCARGTAEYASSPTICPQIAVTVAPVQVSSPGGKSTGWFVADGEMLLDMWMCAVSPSLSHASG